MGKKWLIMPFILVVMFVIFLLININKPKPKSDYFINQTNMKISSPAFQNNETIPARYTCDSDNINPPLYFEDVPEGTKSLVLIVDDPDAPSSTFLHWLVFNIPPETKLIEENSVPLGAKLGKNDFGKIGYGGPCPPYGIHRYYFKLYALNKELDLAEGSLLSEVLAAMKNNVLGESYLIGLYKHQ